MLRSRWSTRTTLNYRSRISRAFLPPYFKPAQPIAEHDVVPLMNLGKYTFVVDIPPNFERDVLGGRDPAVQRNVDATVMVQGGLGTGYVQNIITNEIDDFMSRAEGERLSSVNLRDVRVLFNPNVTTAWFTSVMGMNDPKFGELAGLRIDLNRPAMLFDDDVVTDGQAQPSPFTGRLGRKEGIEQLFLRLREDTGAVVADSDFDAVTQVLSLCSQHRLVVVST